MCFSYIGTGMYCIKKLGTKYSAPYKNHGESEIKLVFKYKYEKL